MSSAEAASVRGRDRQLDNLRAILMFLVVFGHFLQPGISSNPAFRLVFIGIYSFHMPVFAFLSGHVLKRQGGRFNPFSLIVPFALAQVLYALLCVAFGEAPDYYSLLWYLIALFAWNWATPLLARKIRASFLIAAAFALCLAVGFFPTGHWRYVSPRILTYYPFFLLGFSFRQESFPGTGKPPGAAFVSVAGLVAVTAVGFLVWTFARDATLSHKIVFLNQDYAAMGLTPLGGLMTRTLVILSASAAGTFLVAVVPKRKTVLSFIGENTLIVYLAHGFIIKAMGSRDILAGLGLPILVVLSLIVTFLFSPSFLSAPLKRFNRFLLVRVGARDDRAVGLICLITLIVAVLVQILIVLDGRL